MKQAFIGLALILLGATCQTSAQASTFNYDVSIDLFGGTVITGNIVTNCDNGCAVDPTTLVAYSFTSSTTGTTLTNGNLYGAPLLVANGTGIFFNAPVFIGPVALNMIFAAGSGLSQPQLYLSSNDSITFYDPLGLAGLGGFPFPFQIATFTTDPSQLPALTPLPESLPLFATGLLAMAFFGWMAAKATAPVA